MTYRIEVLHSDGRSTIFREGFAFVEDDGRLHVLSGSDGECVALYPPGRWACAAKAGDARLREVGLNELVDPEAPPAADTVVDDATGVPLTAADWKARRDIWYDCWSREADKVAATEARVANRERRIDELDAEVSELRTQLAEAQARRPAIEGNRAAALRRLRDCAAKCALCSASPSHAASIERDYATARRLT